MAVGVAEHLEFDMPRRFEEFFHVQGGVAEGLASLGTGEAGGIDEVGFRMHHAHAAPAAAAGSLENDRIADLPGQGLHGLRVVGQGAVGARYAGDARLFHGDLGGNLVAHEANGLGTRADEGKAAFLHPLGKIGIFREETVAGVDGLGVGDLGGGDDGGDVEIALVARGRADADGFVGELDVNQVAVGFGVYGDGANAQFPAGPLHAQGDFSAVGDEDLFKHLSAREQ
jgi:hypothetical protein